MRRLAGLSPTLRGRLGLPVERDLYFTPPWDWRRGERLP
jgi:hypothetical protein